jgi:CBS domain-containing protein
MEKVAYSRLATVRPDTLLLEVAKLLSGTQISLVIVCNPAGAMVGVITKTDVVQRIGYCIGSACQTLAADIMTGDVTFCRSCDLLIDVLSVIEKRGLVHIPLIDENFMPLGVVNARDALRSLVAEGQYEESLLRNYVMGVGYQ